jgi:hypothetical protein
MFSAGDLVACIDNEPKKGLIRAIVPIHHLLTRGRIYRVESVNLTRFGTPTLALVGVPLPKPMRGFEPYRFRKIMPADGEFLESEWLREPSENVPVA